MTRVPVPWSTQSTKAQSGVVSSERLVNCYLEVNPPNSKSQATIYGDAGLKLWSTIIESPIRGMLLFGSVHLFVIAGESCYVVTKDKVARNIGAIPGHDAVSMCANATHVAIATNLGLYAATVTSIVNVDANCYSSATYQDGYGIFSLAGTEQFYISGLDDMTTVSPIDFTSADTFADNLRGCISDHRELIAFGDETIEHYYNSGDQYFPFSRTPGGFIETGCAASGSIAKKANWVFWLSNDGAVWAMAGYQPKRISTPGVERTIRSYANRESATAFCYSIEGHDNYALSFPEGTLVYDITTGLWRERESFGVGRWRAESYVSAWGKGVVSDFSSGNIYELDLETYDENGDQLIRTMQSAPMHGGGRRVLMSQLYVDAEMGDITGAGGTAYEDPQFMLQWSDDGGRTWATAEQRSAGKTGEYQHRAIWHRLGSFYQRTVRLSISDPCKLAVVGAYAEIEVCER